MKLIRIAAVLERTGLSRTTIWRLEREGLFPARRRLGPNSVAYLESEIDEWVAGRPTLRPTSISEAGEPDWGPR